MVDIIVTPISNQYGLTVKYYGKLAQELRGREKSFAENFTKRMDIGLNFVHSGECTYQNGIFSNIGNLSSREVNYLLTTLLEIASELNEDATVYYEKSNITDSYKNYGFYPFLYWCKQYPHSCNKNSWLFIAGCFHF
mgnify:CR=1 FL=1